MPQTQSPAVTQAETLSSPLHQEQASAGGISDSLNVSPIAPAPVCEKPCSWFPRDENKPLSRTLGTIGLLPDARRELTPSAERRGSAAGPWAGAPALPRGGEGGRSLAGAFPGAR